MLGPLGAVQVIHPDDKEKDREVFSEVRAFLLLGTSMNKDKKKGRSPIRLAPSPHSRSLSTED
jgi:hypothetical protein